MSRSYSMCIEFDSIEPYGDNARLILNSGWTPCFRGSMIYSPPESVSQREIEEPYNLEKLMGVIRDKEGLGEVIGFLATHPQLQYCCSFDFSPERWLLVGLSNESETIGLMSDVPDFNFYTQSVLGIFVGEGRRINKFSFRYG